MKNFIILLTFLTSVSALASATRVLDGAQITNGAATLTLPTSTSTLSTLSLSETLTNKSMSGASNTFTLIPVGAIGNGSVLSGSNTGDVTASAFGSSPNANGFSLSGQAFTMQPADATHPGGVLASDYVSWTAKQPAGNYITALTGDVAASGPGSAAATLATVNSNVGTFANAQVTVNAKGLVTAVSAGTGSSPSITGSTGTPSAIVAGTGVAFTGTNYSNTWFIQGSGGAVTVSASPQIAAATNVGQRLTLIGESNTNTVTLADGTGLSLNGSWLGGLQSALELEWDGSVWVETSRR